MKLRLASLRAAIAAGAVTLLLQPARLHADSAAKPAEKPSALSSKLDELRGLFGEEPKTDPANTYVRYEEGENGGALQLRDVTFEGPQGQKLELTGAIHIGDAAYYEALNTHLKQFDSVLFELVAPATEVAALQKGKKFTSKEAEGGVSLSEIYKMLADDILHLTSQMERIDYTLPAMVHADFTDVEFSSALKEKNLSPQDIMGSISPGRLKLVLSILKWFIPKDDPAAVKRAMAPAFGRMAAGINDGSSALNEIIIKQRNKRALEVLDAQVAAGKKNLSIFYGAGHFPDLTAALLAKGWKQTGESWRTAWSVPNAGTAPAKAEAGKP